MSASLVAACLWGVAANVVALLPSRRRHWPQAWALIAVGIPILGWVTYQNGMLVGLVVLAAGMSVLRWPVRHLWRWLGRRAGRGAAE
jgi:hypothetical protein